MGGFVGLGQDFEIKNFSLTTSDTTVTFTRPTKSIVFRVSGADVELRRNTAGLQVPGNWRSCLKFRGRYFSRINKMDRKI